MRRVFPWIAFSALVLVALSIGSTSRQLRSDDPPTKAAAPTINADPKRIEVPLNGHVFSLPEGFTIELVAGPPLVNRPITASFDEEGRLYVSDSSGTNDPSAKQLIDKPHRVVRLEDTDEDGKFDKSGVFADKLMFPEGTLWHDGSLYVAAPPSIWKLTDTDGDGVADQREEWFKGNTLTGCANDLHGPYLGPDGYLYWTKGAFAEQTYERPVHLNAGEPNRPNAGEPGSVSPRTDSTGTDAKVRGLTLPGSPDEKSVETNPWTTKASHIFRARPDAPRDPATGSIKTSAIECVMTGGMDNPVDVVFTPTGERIFTTTFLVHPGGGNRDGLLHAVYGGVYGKDWNVIDSPSHPRTGDVMPVLCHLGAAAPCGLERLQSSAWGREYQDNLFACCFNMRKVTRHVLRPHGATFQTEAEDFVVSNNLDFHPTDVLEDADGSLLIVDTGGWYKLCCPTSQLWKPDVLGAIYRVRRTDFGPPIQLGPVKLFKGQRSDPYGRKIEWAKQSPEQLAKWSIDPRPFVRRRASNQLAKLGTDGLDGVISAIKSRLKFGDEVRLATRNEWVREDLARLLWSLVRVDDPRAREMMKTIRTMRASDAPEALAIAAYDASLWRDVESVEPLIARLSRTSAAESRSQSSPVAPRQEKPSARSTSNEQSAFNARSAIVSRSETATLKRPAAEALGRIGDRHAIAPLLAEAGSVGDDRFLEHSVIFALIELAQPEATRAGLAASNPATVKAALIALDQMPNGGLKPEEVAKYLTSPEPLLRETAAWIISRHADWGEALAGYLRERLAADVTRSVSEGERSVGLTDAEQKTLGQQLAQFAKAPSVQELLAATVRDTKLPTSARLTALGAMRDSKLKELPRSWSAALLNVLGEDDLSLISLAVNTARAIVPAKEDTAAWRKPLLLVARSQRDLAANPGDSGLRTLPLDALAALPGGMAASEADDTLFDLLLSQLASELSVVQRGTASEVLSKAKLSKAQLTKLTEQFATTGPLEVDRLLAAFEQSTDEQVGQQLIAQLKTAPALTALRADAIKTRLAKYSPSVQEAAQPLYAALNVDLGQQRKQLEEMLASLPPGDIVRGQKVFHNEKAACKACHALGYLGGKTGPDLTRIGGIRNERDLLESILFPSASFVRSFEPVLIVTTNGKSVNGLIRRETPDELVIATGPNKEERVARADIEEMKPSSISIMPAGLDKQLTKEQLADLIAFLKNCK